MLLDKKKRNTMLPLNICNNVNKNPANKNNTFIATIYSKKEIIKIFDYEDTNDTEDFINVLAGKKVTIEGECFDEDIGQSIYVCKEYPEYAIPQCYLKPLSRQFIYSFSNRVFKKIFKIMEKENTVEDFKAFLIS
jgi:hypothetical protein